MGRLALVRQFAIIESGVSNETYCRIHAGAGGLYRVCRGIASANTQGATPDEARENLKEAVQLVLEANRELAERTLAGQNVCKEPFALSLE